MRRPSLDRRDRRALFAGAAVLVPALLWTFAVAPYLRAVTDARARLAAERALLDRELALLASAETYPEAFEEGAARLLAAAPRLFGGGNDGAASAALARYLEANARASRVLLVQVDPIAAEDAGGVVRLGLRVRAETDLEGLLTLLRRLGSGAKLIRVESLHVEAAQADPQLALSQPEVLRIDFTVRGYALGDAPAGDATIVARTVTP
ncbi:MAG TPA: type II secretion system protein GspM [Longimicrobiales bacterium]